MHAGGGTDEGYGQPYPHCPDAHLLNDKYWWRSRLHSCRGEQSTRSTREKSSAMVVRTGNPIRRRSPCWWQNTTTVRIGD